MKKLTNIQKDFLLDTFFENKQYNGWKSVAYNLLDTGVCTVAGNTCIWRGGVGNFITLEKAENLVDCVVYKLDLEEFLSSEHFKDAQARMKVVLEREVRFKTKSLEELTSL